MKQMLMRANFDPFSSWFYYSASLSRTVIFGKQDGSWPSIINNHSMYFSAKDRVGAPEVYSILYIILLTLSENIVDLNEK